MDSVLISLMGFSGFSWKHFQIVLINFSESIHLRAKHTITWANELLRGSCRSSALDLALDSLPHYVFHERKGQHAIDPFPNSYSMKKREDQPQFPFPS